MKLIDIMNDEDFKNLLSISTEDISKIPKTKTKKKPEQKKKGEYKNNNLVKVLSYIEKVCFNNNFF